MGIEEELEEKVSPIEQRTKCKGFALAQWFAFLENTYSHAKIYFLSCFLL